MSNNIANTLQQLKQLRQEAPTGSFVGTWTGKIRPNACLLPVDEIKLLLPPPATTNQQQQPNSNNQPLNPQPSRAQTICNGVHVLIVNMLTASVECLADLETDTEMHTLIDQLQAAAWDLCLAIRQPREPLFVLYEASVGAETGWVVSDDINRHGGWEQRYYTFRDVVKQCIQVLDRMRNCIPPITDQATNKTLVASMQAVMSLSVGIRSAQQLLLDTRECVRGF